MDVFATAETHFIFNSTYYNQVDGVAMCSPPSPHVLDMLLHCYVMKEVEGNGTRPSAGVEQQESPRHYFKIPYIR